MLCESTEGKLNIWEITIAYDEAKNKGGIQQADGNKLGKSILVHVKN